MVFAYFFLNCTYILAGDNHVEIFGSDYSIKHIYFYSAQGLIQFIDFVKMFDTFDIAGCLLAYFDIELDYFVNFGKSELIINSFIGMLTNLNLDMHILFSLAITHALYPLSGFC